MMTTISPIRTKPTQGETEGMRSYRYGQKQVYDSPMILPSRLRNLVVPPLPAQVLVPIQLQELGSPHPIALAQSLTPLRSQLAVPDLPAFRVALLGYASLPDLGVHAGYPECMCPILRARAHAKAPFNHFPDSE